MSLRKKVLSGLYWSLAQQFSSQGISFIVSIIMARLLMPAEFGIIGMINIFMSIGLTLMNSGLTISLIRTINADQEDYSTVFFFNLLGSILIYLTLFISAPYIADFYNQPILIDIIRIYCISFIITAFSTVQMTRLTKEMKFKIQMIVAIPSLIGSGLVGIVLAYLGFGVWALVYMSLVQITLSTIQLWFYSNWRPSLVFNRQKFKYHFSYGYKLTLSGILDALFTNAYSIIIGKYFSPAQVGFYNRADALKQLPVSNISSVLNKITLPLFAQIQNDDLRLKSIFKKIMQMVVFLVAPTLIILAVLAEPLFRFLFTEKWLPAVPYFQILCFNGILYPIHAYNLNVLKVKGKSDLFLKLEIIKKIVLVLIIAVSFQFGIYGLLYGSVLFSVGAFFINTHYTGKFLNYTSWEQTKDILPIIFLAFFCGFLLFFVDYFTKDYISYDIFRLILGGILGGGLFLSLALILKMDSLVELKNILKGK